MFSFISVSNIRSDGFLFYLGLAFCMKRALLVLFFLFPFVHAEVCELPPHLQVTPDFSEGIAGSLQSYILTITNINPWVWCPRTFTILTDVPPQVKRFDPIKNATNVTVPAQNESRNFTLKFSTLPNATTGNYTLSIRVAGQSFEGTPYENTTTALLGVTSQSIDLPDLEITRIGYHCFDRTGIPRSTCYLYDSFSLDNVTVNNTGTRDYDWNITVEARNDGPNISHVFVAVHVPPVPSNDSVFVELGSSAITTFAVAETHTIQVQVYPGGVIDEIDEENNIFTLSVGVSAGYPPGCFYNNPSCDIGYTCIDNVCVPLQTPTLIPTVSITPTPNATVTPTPLPTIFVSDIEDLRNEALDGGENVSEVDRLLQESFSLQRQGRYAEALAKVEAARERAKEFASKVRGTNAGSYLAISLGFLFVLLLFIAILVIRKRKHEEEKQSPNMETFSSHPSDVVFPEFNTQVPPEKSAQISIPEKKESEPKPML